jgi:ABC-type methionine transport system ATPase subunit
LDDCLSAVDSHTAKHIFHHCISGDLLKGRTIILVTHHVRLCLPGAHYLVKLEKGIVAGHGFVDALKASGELVQLLGEEAVGNDTKSPDDSDDDDDSHSVVDEEDYDIDRTTAVNKLVKEEESAEGHVKYDVYKTYIEACGGWPFWATLIFSYIISRFFTFAENW